MIADKGLRDLFKSESEEHLQTLDSGLLALEKPPVAPALLEELFRAAHSLKGAARMLGLGDLESLSHGFEDILGGVRRDPSTITPELLARLAAALVDMRSMAHFSLTGRGATVSVSDALAKLRDKAFAPAISRHQPLASLTAQAANAAATASPPTSAAALRPTASAAEAPPVPPATPTPSAAAQPAPQPAIAPVPPAAAGVAAAAPPDPPAATSPPPETPLAQDTYRIDTVRVETAQLDALLTQSGELSVTRGRIARRLAELGEMVEGLEEALHPYNSSRQPVATAPLVARMQTLQTALQTLHAALYQDSARLGLVADGLLEDIHQVRLLPLSIVFGLFPRMVHDLALTEGKQVEFVMKGGEVKADKRIIEDMKDPIMHLLRNAIDHGIESPADRQAEGKLPVGKLTLSATRTPTHIAIEISDDGAGLNPDDIRQTALSRHLASEAELAGMTTEQINTLIFTSGFSTRAFVTETSGRGVGLDVVRNNVERLKGSVLLENHPNEGLTFRLLLPTTLATLRVMIVRCQGGHYALPTEQIKSAFFVDEASRYSLEGRSALSRGGEVVPLLPLATMLNLPAVAQPTTKLHPSHQAAPRQPCILLAKGEQRLGLLVDELIEEQEVVVRHQGGILKRVRHVSGATILETGEICPILNPSDLLKAAAQCRLRPAPPVAPSTPARQYRILLVEDSMTTRVQEKRILEDAGYLVTTAVDGVDGYTQLNQQPFDAVVSDINMPNMDGLTLTQHIRQDPRHAHVPIILVTALASEEDKRRGVEAGANAYITKPTFDQHVLLECLERLI